MKLKELSYYKATDAEALFRIVEDPETNVLMGYYANPDVGTWGHHASIITDIEMGNSLVAPITRGEACQLLAKWGVAPDGYDS